MNREQELQHYSKLAEHHGAMAKSFRKLAKSHSRIADAQSDQAVATHHRDLAAHSESMAKTCDDTQEHFEQMREKLSAGSGATQMDSHSSAGDVLMRSATANLLDADGRIDFRKLVSAEF